MTTPLISDATLAKIVRLAFASALLDSERAHIVWLVVDGKVAAALDAANREAAEARGIAAPRLPSIEALCAALEEANAEAARNSVETSDTEPPGGWSAQAAEMTRKP